MAVRLGSFLGSFAFLRMVLSWLFTFRNPRLNVTIGKIRFPNPVGLAGGFDKNAMLTNVIPCVGFGFHEIGSVTSLPCAGNPKPRVFRLPKDNALVIHYGLANEGSSAVAKRIKQRIKNSRRTIPLGINIAKTNDPSIKGNASVEDYLASYRLLSGIGDYVTINISCPNAGDGRSFEDPALLEKLLKRMKIGRPVFLKVSPDISQKTADALLKLAKKYGISGFIVSNLTHDRTNLVSPQPIVNKTVGAISGIPLRDKSDSLLKYMYSRSKSAGYRLVFIGVGGIFTAEDAYRKIKNGASLVQLITSLIYEGPGVVKKINKGLIKCLDRDGFNSISEAVGRNVGNSEA